MNILAFESSCDETAVAVVKDGRSVLSSVIASSADMHLLYITIFLKHILSAPPQYPVPRVIELVHALVVVAVFSINSPSI